MNNRLIKSNDAGGGACTNTVDLYNPFPDGGGVALYQLNGDATDVSGNYDGTATNVTYGTGQFGQAGVFNGSSSFLDSSGFGITGNRSVSFWVKNNSAANGATVINTCNTTSSGEQGILVRVDTSVNKYYLSVSPPVSPTPYIGDTSSNWSHITIIDDSVNYKIYFNGAYVTQTAVQTTREQLNKLRIGRRFLFDQYFSGSVDQVRIFSRALRPYEVEALYTEEYCTPTIVPSEHFNTVLYDNNNTVPQSITGVGFQPDLVWIKDRNNAEPHVLFDSLRGVGNYISSNTTNAEINNSTTLTSFDADGFSVGTDSVGYVNYTNRGPYVAWCLKANGGTTVTNTDGAVTNTLQVNQDAGFSIGSWTGTGVQNASIGHGLSQAPEIIIYRNRSAVTNWDFMTTLIDGSYDFMYLNSTNAAGGAGETAPSDTLAYMWGGIGQNRLNDNYVGYFFHSVEGFSNFGSYVGTAASGNTVVTGFEPAFVLIKRTDAAGGWLLLDNKRDTTNPRDLFLSPNTSQAEFPVTNGADFLENGFTMQSTNGSLNASGGSYIYMAFAADPTTIEPSLEDSFNTVIYSGDGSADNPVTGVGFQPDFVWIKPRYDVDNHCLQDSVRGIDRAVYSNRTTQERVGLTAGNTAAANTGLKSFDSDGFTLGAWNNVNTSGTNNYVSWCWKGAELPAINSNGSIPSVVSANTAAGFSIVSYTGTDVNNTIGHGLGIAPDVIIIKDRTIARNWRVYHSAIGAGQNLKLNTTDAASNDAAIFLSTTPTENVFYVGASGDVNANTDNFIAYCFAEVAGFSKFGSYSGTDAAGNYVETGFEPAFVLIKRSIGGAGNWIMKDNKRNPTNPVTNNLYANLSNEANDVTTLSIDFNPLGFTVNGTSGDVNDTGTNNYIYMAFANQF